MEILASIQFVGAIAVQRNFYYSNSKQALLLKIVVASSSVETLLQKRYTRQTEELICKN